MGGSSRRCGRTIRSRVVAVAVCALMITSCTSASYQTEAMQASEGGDQKAAISLAKKEVARFSRPTNALAPPASTAGRLRWLTALWPATRYWTATELPEKGVSAVPKRR